MGETLQSMVKVMGIVLCIGMLFGDRMTRCVSILAGVALLMFLIDKGLVQ